MTRHSAGRRSARWRGTLLRLLLLLAGLGLAAVFGTSALVCASVRGELRSAEEAADWGGDCILVLGAGVKADGRPSPMLRERIDMGIQLYRAGAAGKLLMSGDHGRSDYDEVNAMKDAAMSAGTPSSDVFMDHAGFSTYESLYRARDVFAAKRIVIVSQRYHLYRALYIARRLGLEAIGVASDRQVFAGQSARELREVLARDKDVLWCLLRPEPTYLGEVIPIFGDGDATNDRA